MCGAVQGGKVKAIHNVSTCHESGNLRKRKKSFLFPRTRASKERRFQERKVTANTVVFSFISAAQVPPKIPNSSTCFFCALQIINNCF